MSSNSIGRGKVNVTVTLTFEDARALGKLAFHNDLSRNEYVRRWLRLALNQGVQFAKAASIIALLLVVLWATVGDDHMARLARGRRGGRRDEPWLDCLEGGEA